MTLLFPNPQPPKALGLADSDIAKPRKWPQPLARGKCAWWGMVVAVLVLIIKLMYGMWKHLDVNS